MFKNSLDSKLDAMILSALEELDEHKSTSEEYGLVVDRVAKLEKLKSNPGPKPLSLDTVLVVGANIFGILWLARFEREHVIKAPNAFKFVMKP